MIQLTEISSLTNFKRTRCRGGEETEKNRTPQVLTVNGRAEIVVQDVASYQRMLDALDRAEAIEEIRRGLESAARGEGRPAEDIFTEIRSELDLDSNS